MSEKYDALSPEDKEVFKAGFNECLNAVVKMVDNYTLVGLHLAPIRSLEYELQILKDTYQ